jgi:hypothetical protein
MVVLLCRPMNASILAEDAGGLLCRMPVLRLMCRALPMP